MRAGDPDSAHAAPAAGLHTDGGILDHHATLVLGAAS